jgi:hypothetical protein
MVQAKEAVATIAEIAPLRPFDEAAALEWLRSQPDGRRPRSVSAGDGMLSQSGGVSANGRRPDSSLGAGMSSRWSAGPMP